MQSLKNFSSSKPILKPKASQLAISISPQPPTENRLPPNLERDTISRNNPAKRERISLRDSIDYDKLSPNEQAKWDAGMFGSIHLKEDRGRQYYVVRWVDPNTKSLRSNVLGKTYEQAKATLKKMVLG